MGTNAIGTVMRDLSRSQRSRCGRRVGAQPYADPVLPSWTPVALSRPDEVRDGPSGGVRVNQLNLGVLARSSKENERRLPLHPHHLDRIPVTSEPASTSNVATGSATACPTTSWAGSPASGPVSSSSGSATSSCNPSRCSRHRRDARRAGPLGVAALRAGRGAHTAGHRPAIHADRLRGDEPLDQRRLVQPARLPQEQRACRLLLRLHALQINGSTGDYGRRLRPCSASARPPAER